MFRCFFLRTTCKFHLGFSRVRLKTFSCHECVHLGDGSTELFEKRMLTLFIIVYNRESVSVGRSTWFSRYLKTEFWTHGKVHDSRGGRRARARPRAFRKRAARERQIFVICRPPATIIQTSFFVFEH